MIDLTNKDEIHKIDPQDTLKSTELIADQLSAAWKEVNSIPFPDTFTDVRTLVFCGMGASVYGALVFRALMGNSLSFPTDVVSDYHLPAYVDKHTLVVLTSYSGTTEEVLSCAEEAKAKGARLLVLTKGGPLAEFAKENNLARYIFDGKLNPAGVPRLGNGYTILGLLGLLNKANVVDLEEHVIKQAIGRLREKLPDIKDRAMTDSELFEQKIPIVIAAEHLSGNAQILRNQFNETSKAFSAYYLVPDLNHHLMEGLQFPTKHELYFILLDSENYSPKIQKRMTLTRDVIKQNHHDVHEFRTEGQSFYDDFMEVLAYGSFLTLFLGIRYGQNPAVNPWVDYFKKNLAS